MGRRKTLSDPKMFAAPSLDGETFSHTADVNIRGDVDLTGKLIVGGDLIVEGNLVALDIYCLGNVRVSGNINASNLFVGFMVSAGGRMDVAYIKTGCDVAEIGGAAEIDTEKDDWVNDIVHPDIAESHADEREMNSVDVAVSAGADIICFILETHRGDVEVGGLIDVDIGQIEGSLTAHTIVAHEELKVFGEIDCRGNFWGDEVWAAGDIHCAGNLSGSDITSDYGDILVRGYLKAYSLKTPGNIQAIKWIGASGTLLAGGYIKAGESIVGEQGIKAGEDYGILAGLCVPRSQWDKHGAVSASPRPKNILSGKYVNGVTLDDLDGTKKNRPLVPRFSLQRKKRTS